MNGPNTLMTPKDIDFPDDLTGTITVLQNNVAALVHSVIYEFENGKLKSVAVSYKDKTSICQN